MRRRVLGAALGAGILAQILVSRYRYGCRDLTMAARIQSGPTLRLGAQLRRPCHLIQPPIAELGPKFRFERTIEKFTTMPRIFPIFFWRSHGFSHICLLHLLGAKQLAPRSNFVSRGCRNRSCQRKSRSQRNRLAIHQEDSRWPSKHSRPSSVPSGQACQIWSNWRRPCCRRPRPRRGLSSQLV